MGIMSYLRHPTDRRAGFTIIELIVVVAIVAVLAGVAVPSLGERSVETSLERAADELITFREYARTLAMQRGTLAAMHMDGVRIWYVVEGEQVGHDRYLSTEEIEFDNAPAAFCFDARGIAASGGACGVAARTVELRKRGSSVSLTFLPGGAVLR
jgi:type II secretion system protein H